MNLAQKLLLAAVSAAALACSTSAWAQWAWRDDSGKMVYSDQPPPQSVPAKSIVRQPPAPARPTVRVTTPAEAPVEAKSPPAAAAPPTVVEREIESRRQQQLLAESEKKAAEAQAQQARNADNCQRLRSYLRGLEGGFRIARINAAGQEEILAGAAREAETTRTRAEIERDCK